ncbi:T9SS type B sorting domain-containing protein [Epilithonimonas xixisoli]|nr:T9SS type B sorting domain-containing protein [Epilithonimonas xixisoli]
MSKSIFFKFLFFILIFKTITINAQLDLEHWFSPIYLQNNHTITSITLNLSTPSSNPVEIKVFDANNNIIKNELISNSSPLVYTLPLSVYLASKYEGMRPIKKGFHVSGSSSFYASVKLNFDGGKNTELITSKGKTAIGNLFYSVNAPYQSFSKKDNINFQSNIIATKDNTKIKISGYSPKITFADGKKYPDGIEINLNKGESYCLVTTKADNSNNDPVLDYLYWDSFVGSKIESDKPIAITSGNFEGNYFFEKGGKILIDQSVPVKSIGSEYYIRKGFASIDWEVEGALIVSTENNNKIYLNGSSTPSFTLNEGDFKILKSTDFKDEGIFAKSEKPIYFYQFSAGNNHNEKLILYPYLTPTMAFVPPLDSTLPNTIGTINDIEKIDQFSLDNLVHVLAYKPSNILINTQNHTSFLDISGSTDWKYLTVKNLKGDINLSSENSIIMGVIGGFETEKRTGSFSGYYTGYSNDPYILVNGNCIQEVVTLQLSNIDFETFQWQLNNVDIPGASASSFTPTQEGNYTCIVSYSGFTFKTSSVEVKNCNYTITDISIANYCGEANYKPSFSAPNENIPISKIEILTQPNNGLASITDNNLIIKANQNYSGSDRVIIKLTSTIGITEIQKIDYNISQNPIADLLGNIDPKVVNNQTYIYNLEDAIVNYNNESFKFYENRDDVDTNNPIQTDIRNYETSLNKIYVLITNASGCSIIKEIILNKPTIIDSDTLLLPNVFTPNNDGVNDYFDFSKLTDVSDLKLRIFDRFGKEVYQFKPGTSYKWDGKSNSGISFPSNTYWVLYQFYDPKLNITISKTQWLLLKND